MSAKGLAWAIDEAPTTSGSQSAVLMFMAYKANSDGFLWWSAGKIGPKLGMSRNTVNKYLSELAAAGLIVRVKRRVRADGKHGPWLYWVPFSARPACLPDGEKWPEVKQAEVNLRRLDRLKIGPGACGQPVDEPVENYPRPDIKMTTRLGMGRDNPSCQQNTQEEKDNRENGSVTYIADLADRFKAS